MKIIFDDIDQMTNFIAELCPGMIIHGGPFVIGNPVVECENSNQYGCPKCWKKYCEMEVKENGTD